MACEAECRAFLTIQAGFAFHLFFWDKNHHKRIANIRKVFCKIGTMV
jgi:hypothetical protein